MSGTFLEVLPKTKGELVQFKPEEVRGDLEKLDLLASYGAKLRDDTKLYELAVRKLEIIVDIVDWWGRNVAPPGPHLERQPAGSITMKAGLEALGYKTDRVLVKWRALSKAAEKDTDATIEKIVNGWKMRAGLMVADPKPHKELDHDTAVEAIFRAYTKLDLDQRDELKAMILAFDKKQPKYEDEFGVS